MHKDSTEAGPDFSEIVNIVRQRQADRHPLLLDMDDIRIRYNGDWTVPLGSTEDGPDLPPMTPTIIAETVDFKARQAASVNPALNFPALSNSDLSIKRANTRRRAMLAVQEHSHWDLFVRRWYRFLAGYAHACAVIMPDNDARLPTFELRNPLGAFPEPVSPDEFRQPYDCGFITQRSATWIRKHFPEACTELGGIIPEGHRVGSTDMWEIVEWLDGEVKVYGILGKHMNRDTRGRTSGFRDAAGKFMELRRYPNRCDMPPLVFANELTLDRIGSQISNVTGIVDFMTRLQALAVEAAEKNIYRDRYVVGRSGANPRLADGQWHDGRTGMMNIVVDADSVGELGGNTDPVNQQMIDRLERNSRVSTGLVPQAGGENYTSLRTGRAVDSIIGASVDPRIREMHEVAQNAFTEMNKRALSMWKKSWGSRSYSLYSGQRSDRQLVEITPKNDIETIEHRVEYPIPGADEQTLTVIIGQLMGMKLLSGQQGRRLHPYVDDALAEAAMVEKEAMEEAALAGLAQGVLSGEVPVTYLAKVQRHRAKTHDIFDAIEAADEELKAEQAQMAPEPDPMAGEFAAPEQMPGIAGDPGAPPSPSQLPPELMAMMAQGAGAPGPGGPGPGPGGPGPGRPPGMPAGAMPGDMVPREDQRGLRRIIEALSQSPPSGVGP